MSKILLSSLVLCACVAFAGPKPSEVNPAATSKATVQKAREKGEATHTWASCIKEYKKNRDSVDEQITQYTNHLAQLEVILATGTDRVALTNAIAALSGAAKTAANKSLNYEDAKDTKVKQMLNDLKAVGANLKQAMNDLKQATQAAMEGK
jgi:prefoldin subunit 5